MSQKIKVNIKVRQVIQYDQDLEISKEEFEKLKALNGDDVHPHENGYHDIENVLDVTNILDSEEWLDFEITPKQ